MDERLEREREFHDEVFTGDRRKPTDRFYAINGPSRSEYQRLISARSFGKRVLEYGCATGSNSFVLARNGATVTGIDISGAALALARAKAVADGLAGRVQFLEMNAEKLEFPDASFDLVCGTGILHHLDLGRVFPELARVIAPGGCCIFLEPMGHNPLINLYRRATPRLRTADEHPLRVSDLEAARGSFGEVNGHYFHLATILGVPLRERAAFPTILRGLQAIDQQLFRFIPATQRLAWQVVLELSGPRPAAGTPRAPAPVAVAGAFAAGVTREPTPAPVAEVVAAVAGLAGAPAGAAGPGAAGAAAPEPASANQGA